MPSRTSNTPRSTGAPSQVKIQNLTEARAALKPFIEREFLPRR
ncbi:MAG: hypothetical protein NT107_11065 [Planctomycetota bacterium]|nr:hypothetical protein [Planctomycetota bacterium]